MTAKLIVKDNGSIRIEGDFEIYDQRGNRFDLGGREAVSLCRCGSSATMPFCDGAHKKCEFVSQVNAFALEPK